MPCARRCMRLGAERRAPRAARKPLAVLGQGRLGQTHAQDHALDQAGACAKRLSAACLLGGERRCRAAASNPSRGTTDYAATQPAGAGCLAGARLGGGPQPRSGGQYGGEFGAGARGALRNGGGSLMRCGDRWSRRDGRSVRPIRHRPRSGLQRTYPPTLRCRYAMASGLTRRSRQTQRQDRPRDRASDRGGS